MNFIKVLHTSIQHAQFNDGIEYFGSESYIRPIDKTTFAMKLAAALLQKKSLYGIAQL